MAFKDVFCLLPRKMQSKIYAANNYNDKAKMTNRLIYSGFCIFDSFEICHSSLFN